MSRERFRIWIIVEVDERYISDLKDSQKQCVEFFQEFSKRHLDNLVFEQLAHGFDSIKGTRDVTFAKYVETVEEAEKLFQTIHKACAYYGKSIKLDGHKPFIEKSYLENKLESLKHDIVAFNLLKNF